MEEGKMKAVMVAAALTAAAGLAYGPVASAQDPAPAAAPSGGTSELDDLFDLEGVTPDPAPAPADSA
ncbi:MAG TPA: hypothetical protein VGF12_06330, partial [Roseateles sp.]